MFKSVSLRQHATSAGAEVPKKKRHAKSKVVVGREDGGTTDFYAVVTIEAQIVQDTYHAPDRGYVTIDRGTISISADGHELILSAGTPHAVTVKMGETVLQISEDEIVWIRNQNVSKVSIDEEGHIRSVKI